MDNRANSYVTAWRSGWIVRLVREGKALAVCNGSNAHLDWSLNRQDIAVDQQGNLYITDGTEDLVRKFRQPEPDL